MATSILAIDIGNSRLKAAVFEGETLRSSTVSNHEEYEEILEKFSREKGFPKYVGIISVAHPKRLEQVVSTAIGFHFEQVYAITVHTSMPIINQYHAPEQLGIDRIAAAIGAQHYCSPPYLVIDAGTALTYELVNETGAYIGGAIAPGIQMRYKSLHAYTSGLPLIEARPVASIVGKDTESSIRAGVQQGVISEVEGMITRYQAQISAPLSIILTGGDSPFLAKSLKNLNFVAPQLVLRGIQRIVQHNLAHA